MKSMQTGWVFLFIFCILGIILFCVLLSTEENDNSKEIIPFSKTENLKTVSVQPSPNPAATPENKAVEQKVVPLQILLVDAAGEAIPNGQITIATHTYQSPGSDFQITNLPGGTYTLYAGAAGYASVTAEIVIPNPEPVQLVMDYTCSFNVTVFEDNVPAAGAEVTLFQGVPVNRPISSRMQIPANQNSPQDGYLILQRAEHSIQITQIAGTPETADLYNPDSGNILYDKPKPGDLIQGWLIDKSRPSEKSTPVPNLQLWDSLSCIQQDKSNSSLAGYLQLQRDQNQLMLRINGSFGASQIHSVTFTNSDGRCSFANLPAAMYFVQASYKDKKSDFMAVRPIDQNITVHFPKTLSQDSTGVVRVETVVANMDQFDDSVRNVGGAQVQLSGIERFILFSDKTNHNGYVEIPNVPRGKYRMSVTPPTRLKAKPESKRVDVVVQEPKTIIKLDFEVDFGVRIEGIVQTLNTKKPVPDYQLLLCHKEVTGRKKWPIYKELTYSKSDANGHFVFHHILPGEYIIKDFPPENKVPDYLHPDSVKLSERSSEKEPKLTVEDKNIEGIIYSVVSGIETRLSGVVVRENGDPVENASINLDSLNYMIASQTLSGKKGEFAMVLALPEGFSNHETVIHARVPATAIEIKKLNSDGTYRTEKETNGYAEEGQTPVTITGGKAIPNIKIILKSTDRGHVLFGSIHTPEGQIPNYIEAFRIIIGQTHPQHPLDEAGQHRLFQAVVVNPDGTYKVDQILAGQFFLNIDPINHPRAEIKDKRNISSLPQVYSTERLSLEMPETQPAMQYDIVLRRESYFQGRVLDKNRTPVANYPVYARLPDDPPGWIVGGSDTDEQGYFLMQVRPGEEYDVGVELKSRMDYFANRLLRIKPPIENIVLVIDRNEDE